MREHFDVFLAVMAALHRERVDYVLVGGYAVIIHGFPRFTQDVDLFVNVDDHNVYLLRKALEYIFHDIALEEITAQELTEYPVIRYASPDGFIIDIIGRLGEMTVYNDLSYETVEIDGIPVRVATPESLYKMKYNTVRPQDRLDAAFLKRLLEQHQEP